MGMRLQWAHSKGGDTSSLIWPKSSLYKLPGDSFLGNSSPKGWSFCLGNLRPFEVFGFFKIPVFLGETYRADLGETNNPFLGETNSAFLGETNTDFLGETNSDFLGETYSAFIGETNTDFLGETNSDFLGETNSAYLGKLLF
jgi:hypothetical protein